MGKKQLFKIIILGDSGVGKTSLMNQYVNEKFTQAYRATVGADFMAKQVNIDNRPITLQIWDTAGQQRFQSLGGAFYRGADCCVMVYDITNQKVTLCLQSFEDLENWKQQFFKQGTPKEAQKFPFVVLGNKLDKASERMVSEQYARQWCEKSKNTCYFETSAKDALNVQSAFTQIARSALTMDKQDQMYKMITSFVPQTVQLNKKTSKKPSKKCC